MIAATVACAVASAGTEAGKAAIDYWPQWRGPLSTGVAPRANPPVTWSESENVRWKLPLPGKGHSTPIVWGDRLFVTAAVPFGEVTEPHYSGLRGGHDELPVTQSHRFLVLAISRSDGAILWKRVVREALPQAGGHFTASLASNSAVTDGEHLFALFGSFGLYCLTLAGEPVWEVDLGAMSTMHGHGEGSSPALYGDTLVVNWDHEGQSFLVALDKRTGAERWRVAREGGSSWTTPILVDAGSRMQVIVSGSNFVSGYALDSGRLLWECGGLSVENVVSSPVFGGGLVFAGSSYDRQAMLAIRLEGSAGNVTGTEQVAWSRNRGAPYVPSPLLYDNALYFIRHFQGILTRVDARTGAEQPGPLRLNGLGYVFASPIAARERLYVTDRSGTTLVLSHENPPRLLARNRLDDSFSASAAAVDGELFLRGERNLYCLTRD